MYAGIVILTVMAVGLFALVVARRASGLFRGTERTSPHETKSLSLLLISALLAGCGEKEGTRSSPRARSRWTLMLDYFPNADHAGIYAAQAGGHFKQAGLDVEIRQPPDPASPIKQVAAGRVDLAISYEPEVLRARDQGLNVVSVGAIVRKPLTSLISLPCRRRSAGRPTSRARRSARLGSTTSRPISRRSSTRRTCRATRSRSATSGSA